MFLRFVENDAVTMARDRYFIDDQNAHYFLTMTVVHWIDVFTRKEYKQIITESLNYCVEKKGLVLFAWVLMSNHYILLPEYKNQKQ